MNDETKEPQEEGLKNGQGERKDLIECLALAYGVTPRDDAGYTFDYGKYNQKEIASQLGYDNSTLGKMLHPDWNKPQNRSYKPMIAVLKKQIEINELKAAERKKSNKLLWAAATSTVFLIISAFFWLSNYMKDLGKTVQAEKHYITNEGDFAAIFSGEAGEAVAYQIANDGYQFIKDFHNSEKSGDTLSGIQRKEVISKFRDIVKRIDGDSRNQLQSLNYVAAFHKELNVVDIIDHITPRDSLFKCPVEAFLLDSLPDCAKRKNAYFDRKLWENRHLFFKGYITEQVFKNGVIDAIRALQQELSKEDKRIFSHFIETGELIEPYKD